MNLWSKIHGHRECIQRIQKRIESGTWPPTSIFYGPPGVGKFLVARAVAQHLTCVTQTGCGHCGACQRVEVEESESLLTVRPETEQVKVDQAREVVRFMYLKNWGPARVVIINEAHQMTTEAVNVLLKTLEEPPADSYLILIIPTLLGFSPTIRSRSQAVQFSLLAPEDLAKIINAPDWVLSGGRVDLANRFLNLGDESRKEMTYGIWSLILEGDVEGAFQKVRDWSKKPQKGRCVVWLWLQMIKAAWTYKWGKSEVGWEGEMVERLSKLGEDQLSKLAFGVVKLEGDIQRRLDGSLCFENYLYQANDWIKEKKGQLW